MLTTDEHHTRVVGTLVLAALAVALIGPGVASASTTNVTDAAGVDSNASLEPIADRLPTDPNGDGLYEDIDGDGRWTFVDVNTFFQQSDESVIRNHTAAYDFDGDGEITLQDTLALLDERYDGDGDGLTTDEERDLGTDPRLADTDGDGVEDGDEVENGTDPTVVNFDAAGVDCGGHCDVSSRSVAVGPSDPITATGPRRTGPIVEIDPNTTYTGDIGPEDADVVVAQDGSGDAETIQGGVDMATAGDVVYVREGTYSEEVLVDERVRIVGPNATLDGSDHKRGYHAFNITSSVTVEGLTITDYYRAFDQTGSAASVTIDSVAVSQGSYLAYATGSAADWTIDNVSANRTGWIYAEQSSGDWTLTRVGMDRGDAVNAIWASGATGEWRLSRVSIDLGEASNAIDADQTAGDWTLSNVSIDLGESSNAIEANGAEGDWALSAVAITAGEASGGVSGDSSSGDWTLREVSVDVGYASNAVWASGATGDWSLADVSLWVGEAGNAIYGSTSAGNWTISYSAIEGSPAGSNGIYGVGADSSVVVRETTVDVGGYGMDLGGADRVSVANVTVSPHDGIGIAVSSIEDRIRISDVAVNGTSSAIRLRGPADGRLDTVRITNARSGIRTTAAASNWSISDVSVNASGRAIVADGMTTLTLSNVAARSQTGDGVVLESIDKTGRISEMAIVSGTRGLVLDGSADWAVETVQIDTDDIGIFSSGVSGSLSTVTIQGASSPGLYFRPISGTWTLSDVRVTNATTGMLVDGSNGSVSVSESRFWDGATGVVIPEENAINVSISESLFRDFETGVETHSPGLDRIDATEFRDTDVAVDANATNATIDARGNWWGADGLTESDTTGDVLTGNACAEPCAGDLWTAGVTAGDILPTSSLITGKGVAVWNQRFGTTESDTITIEYETTALEENATATLIAAPNREPMLWTLDPPTNGTVERRLDANQFDADDSAGEHVTMQLVATDARVRVSNVTVGSGPAAA